MSNSRNFSTLASNVSSGGVLSTDTNIGSLANSASSNTIYLQGVANYQNTTISNVNSLAQSAYNSANNVGPQIQPAFDQANSALILAQGAFNAANNVSPQIQPAFDTANSAVSLAQNAYNSSNTNANNIINTNALAQSSYDTANTKFNISGGNITGPVTISSNLTITGNLTVAGNVTTVSANNMVLKDNLIYLNDGNTVANPDLGFAGNYNDGTYRHAGFFRDASDGIWKIFDEYLPEPDASPYIDTSNSSFRIADFQANNVTFGKISTSSSLSVSNLNADYLDGQHGSYYTTAGNLSGTIPSGVLGNSSLYVGTTSIALNRGSGSQTLTGVSIDGNAGTATSADNIDGIAFKNSNSTSSFIVDSQGTNGIGYSTGYTLFGQSDGGVYCSTYSSDWQHQINGDFRTGQIAIRGKNSGTWQSWRTVLDSSNYNSYSNFETNAVYGGIYYDGNDTNYYCNPAGTSRFESAYFLGGIASASASSNYYDAAVEVREYAFGGAQTDSWAYAPRIGFHWGGRVASQIAMASNGRIAILNNPGNDVEAFQCGNFYSPIFYDVNNTGYYVDPAGTSNVNAVTQNGDIYFPGSGSSWITGLQGGYANIYDNDPNGGNYRAFIRSINANYTFSMGRLSNNYIGFFNYLNTRTVNGTDGSAYLDVSGNWYSSSSMRAPIFYDSNNTAYYLNPADFSELYNIRTYGPNLARTINSTGYAWLFQYSTNSGSSYTNVGSIFMSSSSTQYATTSDYRLKENIHNVEGAINKLMQLQPRTFNFISNPDETIDGFIAHELQEHFPNAVTGQKDAVDENGKIIAQGIDTSKLVATMVSAIQEQQTQIQDLQNKLNSLLHPQQTDK